MAGRRNIDDLLSKGSWATSQPKDAPPTNTSHPRRSATASNRNRTPRNSDSKPRTTRSYTVRTGNKRRPPPPNVEDEITSLAREYLAPPISSDDDVPNLGELEQNPLLIELEVEYVEELKAENLEKEAKAEEVAEDVKVEEVVESLEMVENVEAVKKAVDEAPPQWNSDRRFVLLTDPDDDDRRPERSETISRKHRTSAPEEKPRHVEPEPAIPTRSKTTSSRAGTPTPKSTPVPKVPRTATNDINAPVPSTTANDTPKVKSKKITVEPKRKPKTSSDSNAKPSVEPEARTAGNRRPNEAPKTKARHISDEAVSMSRSNSLDSPPRPGSSSNKENNSPNEANTCLQFIIVPGPNKKPESPARQKLKARKSRQELPHINTSNVDPHFPVPKVRAGHRRSLSANAKVTQENIYDIDSQAPTQPQDTEFLSPTVSRKHSTKGHRDEEFYDDSQTEGKRRSESFHDVRGPVLERKDLSRARKEEVRSASPAHRRTSSTKKSTRDQSKPRRECSNRHRRSSRYHNEDSSRHTDRTATTPVFAAAGVAGAAASRAGLSRGSSRRRERHESPPSDAIASSSEDDRLPYSKARPEHRCSSSMADDERRFVIIPDAGSPSPSRPPPQTKDSRSLPLTSSRESLGSLHSPEPARDSRNRAGPSSFSSIRHPSGFASGSYGYEDSPPLNEADIYRNGYINDVPLIANPTMTTEEPIHASPSIPHPFLASPPVANPSLANPVEWRSRSRSPSYHVPTSTRHDIIRWKPPKFRLPEGRMLSYREFLEGTEKGRYEGLPPCPHRTPEASYYGWLTVAGLKDFTLCADCFQNVFELTRYQSEFIPLPLRPHNMEIACSFGSSYWYQIAWFLTLKYEQSDLRILMSLADTVAAKPPCPGMMFSSQTWYSIIDPFSKKIVPSLTVCGTCIKVVGVLLPTLRSVFKPCEDKPFESYCAFRCDSRSTDNNFLEYFDAMERVADVAMTTRTPADMGDMADKVRVIATVTRCPKDTQVRDGCWYTMRSVSELAVCQECYVDAVMPWIEQGNEVACDFYKASSYLSYGTCQLYSRRMRDVFDKACRRKGIKYLEAKVGERKLMEADIKKQLAVLVMLPDRTVGEEERLDRLTREWAEWE